ncbi:MAG: MerR family transcriptional regulator [Gemmatimonadota bacterium]
MSTYLIGQLARRAETTPETIRFYERRGLLRPPPRDASGYRRYGQQSLRELNAIRSWRKLGFSLDEITTVVEALRDGPSACDPVADVAREHVRELDGLIARLQSRRDALAGALDDCFGEGCRVDLDDLAEGGCLGPAVGAGEAVAGRLFPPPRSNAVGQTA